MLEGEKIRHVVSKRTHPNVISPSFVLSARREILYDTMAAGTSLALARDSIGVKVIC
jgi:hypothetical protein